VRRAFPLLLLLVVLAAVGGSIAWRFRPRERPFVFDSGSVRMVVVNGCGAPKVGRAVADELQARGFDVYGVETSPEHHPRTAVVDLRDRSGTNARNVARALSIQRRWWRVPLHGQVMPDTLVNIDSSRYLEVRLVVGEDYRRFFPTVIPLY